MVSFEKGELRVNLKKESLALEDYNAIIATSVSAFLDGDTLNEEIGFSYILLQNVFFQSLGTICIEDFDDELHHKIFKEGMIDEIIERITNAQKALETAYKTAEKAYSLESVIDKNLGNIIRLIEQKIPDKKSMEKIMNKLPKEWQKTFDEYKQITKNEGE